MTPSFLAAWLADAKRATQVMGILNVTPDSFSDGGRFAARDTALRHAEAMIADGVDWIDVGAESTRPGSSRVSAREQLERLAPVLGELRKRAGVVLSIDTTIATVAEYAFDAGVDLLNDISAGRDDPAILPLVARRGAPVILMHMQGEPTTMQSNPVYEDVTAEVAAFLQDRALAAESAGVSREKILLDPGIGFGKTLRHNLQLLRDLPTLAAMGRGIVVGASRKGFIGAVTGESAESGRVFGTAAAVAWSAAQGAAVVRVHDVRAMKPVVQMIGAIQRAAE